jgi:hypothetical protein
MPAHKKNLKILESLDQPPLDAPAQFDATLLQDSDPEVTADLAAAEAAWSDSEIHEPPIGEPAIIAAEGTVLVAVPAQDEPDDGGTPDGSGDPLAAAPLAPRPHDGILTDNNNVAASVLDDTIEPSAATDGAAAEVTAGGKGAPKHYVATSPELNSKLKRLAGQEGATVSALVRRVLTAFADGQPAAVTGATKVDTVSEALDRVLAQAHEVEATFVRMGVGVVDVGAAHAV